MATLSELRKPGSDEISMVGTPTIGRARAMVTISSRRQPLIVEVSPVDKHIMALRLEHVFDFVSPLALYAPPVFANSMRKKRSTTNTSVADKYP